MARVGQWGWGRMLPLVILSVGVAGLWAMPAIAGQLPPAIAQATIPPAIVSTLRQDLSRQTGIPTTQLKWVAATPQTWSDGCLGLANPGEFCTQMMVSGWRVVFVNGKQRWVYRTNQTGRTYRLEPTAP